MKIIIAGGSGQVGGILARAFHADKQEVAVLSRSAHSAPWRTAQWDGATIGSWAEVINGADVVINLAGRSVNCRYNSENRREIIDSRVDSTRVIGEAITGAKRPPKVWLQASTATIYAHTYDTPNDETTGVIGGNEPDVPETWRFSIDVAKRWEQALSDAETPHTRKVTLRSSMIMSPDKGGVFDTLLGLVRHGLGGKSGDGRQFVSWIHVDDFVSSIRFLIENEELSGAVSICSPNPVPNKEFMRKLREAWGAKFGLPATDWILEVGAFFLKTETELILKSRRVVPGRLLDSGFPFKFPDWTTASDDLCGSWREDTSRPLK